MHRYRDAIVLPHPIDPGRFERGAVIGAAVLFPYPDEEGYRTHRFFGGLKAVDIGGLPFMPGRTTLVGEKLAELLSLAYAGSTSATAS